MRQVVKLIARFVPAPERKDAAPALVRDKNTATIMVGIQARASMATTGDTSLVILAAKLEKLPAIIAPAEKCLAAIAMQPAKKPVQPARVLERNNNLH